MNDSYCASQVNTNTGRECVKGEANLGRKNKGLAGYQVKRTPSILGVAAQ